MYALGVRQFPPPVAAVCREVTEAFVGATFTEEMLTETAV
jgi:hypothetical protein